jgi:succinate dehydrogenase / fumarate reductase iron-sulfur subunit
MRDLVVDRSRMFEALKRVKAWIPADTYDDIGEGPVISAEEQDRMYPISRCMSCGCCFEVCPQVNDSSQFIGPAPIAQAVLFNMNPTGKMSAGERLEALMEPGGISDCGNAQNCVKVCPKEVPLTWAIGKAGRDATVHGIKQWLLK